VSVSVCAQALRDETAHDVPTTSEEEKEEEEIEEDEGRCSDKTATSHVIIGCLRVESRASILPMPDPAMDRNLSQF